MVLLQRSFKWKPEKVSEYKICNMKQPVITLFYNFKSLGNV